VSSCTQSTGSPLVVIDGGRAVDSAAQRVAASVGLPVVCARDAGEARRSLAESRPYAVVLPLHGGDTGPALALVRSLSGPMDGERVPVAFLVEDTDRRAEIAATQIGASLLVRRSARRDELEAALRRLVDEGRADRPQILIVGTDTVALEGVLGADGMRTTTVAPSAPLLRSLDGAEPDLVILSESDGASLDHCRLLRATPRWQDLPILFVGQAESRTAAFSAGADDILPASSPNELLACVRTRVDRARRLRERLERDALTGLLLRRPFLERLDGMLGDADRRQSSVTVGMLDVDRFKVINDRHGHFAGDRVLAALGHLLAARFRAHDLRCRWGGDEVALAIAGARMRTVAEAVMRVVLEFGALRFDDGAGGAFAASLSVGLASFPADGATPEELLAGADERLLSSKRRVAK